MYSHDRRRIIARHVDSLFHSLRKTAIVLKVSHTTIVARWLKSICRKPYPQRKFTKSEKVAETIKAAIAANNPFTSLSQLRKRLGEVFPFTLSRELLRVVIIKKQGLSKKKAKFFSKPTNLEAVSHWCIFEETGSTSCRRANVCFNWWNIFWPPWCRS